MGTRLRPLPSRCVEAVEALLRGLHAGAVGAVHSAERGVAFDEQRFGLGGALGFRQQRAEPDERIRGVGVPVGKSARCSVRLSR